jgi:heat shock protein HslJ
VTATAAVVALTLAACGTAAPEHDAPSPVTGAGAVHVPAPGYDEVRSATFGGLRVTSGTVTLAGGVWERAPAVPGGASRPRVELVRDFRLVADLDGDGREEAVVLLAESGGGSGSLVDLAVAARAGDTVRNLATTFLGDRVQVRDLRFEDGHLAADLVQAGPGDAACCPGELATRWFRFENGRLVETPSRVATTRLSLEALGGVEWVLRRWSLTETAAAGPEVTLSYAGGRFSGRSGCNRYFASATGGAPGAVAIGPAGATQMACEPSVMAVEKRFLDALSRIRRYSFLAGELILSWEQDGAPGSIAFARRR